MASGMKFHVAELLCLACFSQVPQGVRNISRQIVPTSWDHLQPTNRIFMVEALSMDRSRRRFGTTQNADGAKQLRIFCYGDSLTYGTVPSVDEAFPYGPCTERVLTSVLDELRGTDGREMDSLPSSVMVRWRGLPGWTSSTMIECADDPRVGFRAMLRQVDDPKITLAVILAGTNDLAAEFGSPTEEGASNIADSVVGLHQVAHDLFIPTVAVSIPSSGWQAQSADAAAMAKATNEKIESWCRLHSDWAHFVPFPFGFSREDGRWSGDGLHLSPTGYQDLGKSLGICIGHLLFPNDDEIK